MTERMNLNMADLETVTGGAIYNPDQRYCWEHNYVQIGEDWISPPGGVYVSKHLQCTDCGHDYWTEYENMLY